MKTTDKMITKETIEENMYSICDLLDSIKGELSEANQTLKEMKSNTDLINDNMSIVADIDCTLDIINDKIDTMAKDELDEDQNDNFDSEAIVALYEQYVIGDIVIYEIEDKLRAGIVIRSIDGSVDVYEITDSFIRDNEIYSLNNLLYYVSTIALDFNIMNVYNGQVISSNDIVCMMVPIDRQEAIHGINNRIKRSDKHIPPIKYNLRLFTGEALLIIEKYIKKEYDNKNYNESPHSRIPANKILQSKASAQIFLTDWENMSRKELCSKYGISSSTMYRIKFKISKLYGLEF